MVEKVLVVAPHPDDEAIGCGGAICLHRERGDPVRVVFLTSGERGLPELPAEQAWSVREAEAAEAAQVLGVSGLDFLRLPDLGVGDDLERGARALVLVLAAQGPDVIYLPHPGEPHPDHEAALPLVRRAQAALGGERPLPELRGYEVWGPMSAVGWVEVVSAVMPRKLRAIRCYRSQLAQLRYDRAALGLGRYRGVMNGGCRYAEAFQYFDPRLPPEQVGRTGP